MQVCLITSADDPYNWKVLLGKEHLFKKQLSKHLIGAYMELWWEVGVSFEAVPATESKGISQRKPQESTEVKLSFAARIEALQADNVKLNNELNQWRDQAANESELKELTEEEVNQLM